MNHQSAPMSEILGQFLPSSMNHQSSFLTSSSASSPSVPRWDYDIFCSFRGEDVRKNFLSHLDSAFKRAGIRTFKDDNDLARGSEIPETLMEAIERSRIAIIVFSENYADSRWCLKELVKILDCKEKLGQIVLPVFFYVDPSDIRKQKGRFGEAFARHQKATVEEVGRWKTALTDAANLGGFDLQSGNGDESRWIERIVGDVLEKLHGTYPSEVDHQFGIASTVDNIISLLDLGSKDVRFIGIYGLPGIGKTTVAKVIRNTISEKFQGNSLLEDVQRESKHGRLVKLQKKLLYDIIGIRVHLSDIDGGIDKIRRRLKHRRVLIIIDNVDHLDQLKALAKERSWFGIGSRIIVTCRDEHLLNTYGVDAKYEVQRLEYPYDEELFFWHAFGGCDSPEGYADCPCEIVRYAAGHPLALKVLGSFLSDKTLHEWTSALEQLKSIPQDEIFERLKMSFDSLDDNEKNIFLDIALFFVGMNEGNAIRILDGSGFNTKIHLRVLIQKCLLTIRGNELSVHDLLQEMAKEIVRRENPAEPGKRSRMSIDKDVRKVLKYHEGTKKVIGLKGIFSRAKSFSTEALARMNKVRILQLENADFVGSWEHISKELRFLCWKRCPWVSLPPSLNLKRLVVLKLRYSKLEYLWEQTKILKKLKVLDLGHSHDLIRTSDISGLSSVEKLIFKDCINLTEVHHSIGNLSELIYLDLENCKNLVHLPKEICELRFLENLNLYCCSNLKELPEDLGNIESLKDLNIGCTGIENFFVICKVRNLTNLSWKKKRPFPESPGPCNLSPFWKLTSVKRLQLSFCNLTENSLPSALTGSPNLETLLLRGNTFNSLPPCLSHLPKLKHLDVSQCDLSGTTSAMVFASPLLKILDLKENNFCRLSVDLTSLPFACTVNLLNCTSLEKLTFKGGGFEWSEEISQPGHYLYQVGCEKLGEIEGRFKLKPLTRGQLDKLERLFRLESLLNKRLDFYNPFTLTWMDRRPVQGLYDHGCQMCSFFLPGGMIPDWFNYQNNGGSIIVDVPQLSSGSFRGLAICVAYYSSVKYDRGHRGSPLFCMRMEDINMSACYYKYFPMFVGYPDQDEVLWWVSYWRAPALVNECKRFMVKVRLAGADHVTVRGIGYRLTCEEDEEDMDPLLSGERPLNPLPTRDLEDDDLINYWTDSMSTHNICNK